jgi:16S rRNA (guanine527-N7)-methyltransferase
MVTQVENLLSTQCRQLGLRLESGVRAGAAEFVSLLLKWNKRINLVGTNELEVLVTRHVVDSMKIADHVGKSCALVDVGSGAGLPGLVVALCRPDVRVSLVERTVKKAAFLQHARGVLELSNVEIIAQDAVELAGTKTGRFDEAVSRATFSPLKWLELATNLVKKGGVIWLMLGPRQQVEFLDQHPTLRIASGFEYELADGSVRRLIGVSL